MPDTSRTIIRAAFLTLTLASAAVAQRGATAPQGDTVFTWAKKLPDSARFAIRNLNGGIEVRPGTTDRVEVRAIIRQVPEARVKDVGFDVREHSATDVEICTTDLGISACVPEDSWNERHLLVRYIVDLPAGLRLRLATGSGYVIVMQSALEVDATTGGGDVVVRESLGRTVATTGNGDATVAMANGSVRASSGNGRVVVNAALGPVNASSGNGDVEVRLISLAEEVPPLVTSLSSGNGDVRLTLPADFNGDIDASTGQGKVTSDFQVRTTGRQAESRLRGGVGNGMGMRIRINSGNGRVEIRRD